MLTAMAIADLAAPAELVELRARYRGFMDEHLYPSEEALGREDEAAETLLAELRGRAKSAGLWAPHLPPEAGGTGRGFLAYANLNGTVFLRDAANVNVNASMSYVVGTRTLTMVPAAPLSAGMTYTVTIVGGSTGVKDLAGNPLAATVSWCFTTAIAPPTIGVTP